MTDTPFNFQFSDNCFEERYLDNSFIQSNSVSMSPDYDTCHMGDDSPGPFRSPKRRGRPVANNAARERSRVKTLRTAFLDLQKTLPAVPPDTKLSKLDVLVLATTYIAHLMSTLQDGNDVSQILAANGGMHPVKKWPMRSRLYAGILSSTGPRLSRQEEHCSEPDVHQLPWLQETRRYR